jgi:hypothetical protein
VITNPVNLYSQDQIKSMDIALSFHVGLMSRMMARQPSPPAGSGIWMLEVARRLDVASESLDRAREVEDFQAVGMRLRETLPGQPHRIGPVGLGPPRQLFRLAGRDQLHIQPSLFQHIEPDPPVVAGGLQGHLLDALGHQLGGQRPHRTHGGGHCPYGAAPPAWPGRVRGAGAHHP